MVGNPVRVHLGLGSQRARRVACALGTGTVPRPTLPIEPKLDRGAADAEAPWPGRNPPRKISLTNCRCLPAGRSLEVVGRKPPRRGVRLLRPQIEVCRRGRGIRRFALRPLVLWHGITVTYFGIVLPRLYTEAAAESGERYIWIRHSNYVEAYLGSSEW